jgi:hypothetical protein
MWFCDMRQMPRLRDCVYEFTAQILEWLRGLFVRRARRR